jgi:hypothetical protein
MSAIVMLQTHSELHRVPWALFAYLPFTLSPS